MEIIIHSLGSFGNDQDVARTTDSDIDASWKERVSSLIKMAKTVQNRARIAIYATQFIMILCGKEHQSKLSKKSSAHNCLHLQKFNQFWNDIDEASSGYSTSMMAQVFDVSFCTKLLLPLSHHCSMYLAKMFQFPSSGTANCFLLSREMESALSLITILCSVFGIIQKNNLLVGCVHVGWAIEVLSLSIGFFIRSEKLSFFKHSSMKSSPWHQVHDQLTKLYDDAWGDSRLSLNFIKPTTFACIAIEKDDLKRISLMPSFDVLVSSLICVACVESTEFSSDWCKVVSSVLLDRYAPVLPANAVANAWIRSLTVTLQREVIRQKMLEYSKSSIEFTDSEDDVATELALEKLMNPFLKCLHGTIMKQHSLRMFPSSTLATNDRIAIASTFSKLYKEEFAKTLIKPSHKKTRIWHVYRACIERVFVSTPPPVLFASFGSLCLVQSSADALREVCSQFGHSYLGFIMAAAGLAVDNTFHHTCEVKTRTACDAFTLQAKNCIIDYFASTTTSKSPNELAFHYHEFVNKVGRYLHLHAAAAGLLWWSEITSSLDSQFSTADNQMKSGQYATLTNGTKGIDIGRLISSLEENLSAISHCTT
jgi:hypothetical protein